jgi:hypothetical protein
VIDYSQCPACNSRKLTPAPEHRALKVCGACNALFGGPLYLGDSYAVVQPFFATEPVNPKNERYFDFFALGSQGEQRRHGWYDVASKRIVQVG